MMQRGYALYDYNATEEDELSIQAGQAFTLMESFDDDWWLINVEGRVGVVPSNYVRLDDASLDSHLQEPQIDTWNQHPIVDHDSSNNPLIGSPIDASRQEAFYQSTELKRLKDLREKAAASIDALRNTVNTLEAQPVVSKPEISSSQALVVSNKQSTGTVARRIKNLNSEANSHGSSGLQQVTLNPSSIEFISKVVSDKIEREFKARDHRLLQQVQEMIQSSLEHQKPFSQPQLSMNHADDYSEISMGSAFDRKPSSAHHLHKRDENKSQQSHGNNNNNNNNSKIPRIRLPKVNNYTEQHQGRQPKVVTSSRSGKSNSENHSSHSAIPTRQPRPLNAIGKAMNNMNNIAVNPNLNYFHFNMKPVKEEYLSMEGVQYPQCRSTVYPSSQDIAIARNRHLQQQSSPNNLQLSHIFGYDGDANRHGGATRGKNVLWLRNQSRIAYPAAAVVVLMDVSTRQQAFFLGHSDDVTCIVQHPTLPIVASGQLGSEGMILLWNTENSLPGTSTAKADVSELSLGIAVRGISSVDFSGDGKLLLACSMEESRSVYIFDWERRTILCSAKVGHVDACQFKFNPIAFIPFEEDGSQSISSNANKSKASMPGSPMMHPVGCHSLVSFGGKQVKFWTIKAHYAAPTSLPVPSAAENNGRDYRGKQFKVKVLKYALEGSQGIVAKGKKTGISNNSSNVEYNCCCFVGEYGYFEQVKVVLGTSTGAIQIWMQLQEEHSEEAVSLVPSWSTRSKLLAIIADAHESPIMEFDYIRRSGRSGEQLFSSDQSGVINVWTIDRNDRVSPAAAEMAKLSKAERLRALAEEALPLKHLGGVQLEDSFARSVHVDSSGKTAILGLANNSIISLQCSRNKHRSSHHSSNNTGGSGKSNTNESNQSNDHDSVCYNDAALSFAMQQLVICHNGKVRRIAVHPLSRNIFASICTDRTINLWDADSLSNISTIDLEVSATAIAFSSDGTSIAVGNEKGELLILRSITFQQLLHDRQSDGHRHRRKSMQTSSGSIVCTDWELLDCKVVGQNATAGNPSKNTRKSVEITEIKFSPASELVAVGSKDSFVHLLRSQSTSPGAGYRQVGLCKGHTSAVKNIDFSVDGRLLRTTDTSKGLLFWDVESTQRLTNPNTYREANWHTHSVIYGWALQGVFNRSDIENNNQNNRNLAMDSEISCVCRSMDGNVIAASGSHTVRSSFKLFAYPCLPDAVPAFFGGHSSPVLDLQFVESSHSPKGMNLISAGGNDSCLFVWNVVSDIS